MPMRNKPVVFNRSDRMGVGVPMIHDRAQAFRRLIGAGNRPNDARSVDDLCRLLTDEVAELGAARRVLLVLDDTVTNPIRVDALVEALSGAHPRAAGPGK